MLPLYEQYRPKTFGEVVGQEKALLQINTLRKRGLSGRAYWLTGASGTGKTTIAHLLAAEIADKEMVEEIDAGTATPSKLQAIEATASLYGWGKGGRAWIINEAHGLSAAAIRQLLVILERLPRHIMVIFTTTSEAAENIFEQNLDANPLLSRCIEINLARRDLAKPFANRAKEIAMAENMDGAPVEQYIKLAQSCKNNMRKMLQEIESGFMAGK